MNYQKAIYDEEVKCGYCNWNVLTVYAMAGLNIEEHGLCAECFLSMLEEAGCPLGGIKELQDGMKEVPA